MARDSNARTVRSTRSEEGRQLGRTSLLYGIYLGFVKDASDVQRNGRLRVWIPEFGSPPTEDQSWVTVNYCSPFAGATSVNTISKTDFQNFDTTQTSYGFWMVPPDIDNQVLVMFINGDSSKGVWIGSLYDQFMNNMIPGMASNENNWQYPGKQIPVAEYNKNNTSVTQPDKATKPFEKTKFKGLGNQGLINDRRRGTTTSSARREAPSSVFGIITPGPVIDANASPTNIRRKGGSAFIMDDGTGTEYVQLTTKSGAQIRLDETNGFVYLINRDGTAWVQMDKKGNIDIFGATNISMRAQRDFNIRADRNINIEAGQNIFMKAAKDTIEETTTFTYDVNNVPQPSVIPVWSYVGEGNGTGGSIVMQALNNWQTTTQKGAFHTVIENDMNVKVGNTFNLTTVNGSQNFSSKQSINMTTNATFNLAAKDNIRVGSQGVISAIGKEGIIMCTDARMSLKAAGDIVGVAAGSIYFDAADFGVGTDVAINGNLDLTGDITAGTIVGNFPGLRSGPGANTGGPGNAPTELNPDNAQAALSAAPARPAEVKPLNDKTNILATWNDPESKFKRESQKLQTTTSRFPTYEPCPEHENFNPSDVCVSAPIMTPDDKTYVGSSGVGNPQTTPPAASVNPGSNNTSVPGDPVDNSNVSKDVDIVALRCQLIKHEGYVEKSYLDTTNLLHGGIGHLLRANEIAMYPLHSPIPKSQIETWFTQDSSTAIKIAQELLGTTWADLSDVRKRAVIDLSYNLGKARLAQFTLFLAAMRAKNFTLAGNELRNSTWFSQVGRRGPTVVTMISQDVDASGCSKKIRG